MKQVTNMSRLVNQLEKTFKMLNRDFFNDELPIPILTAIPCAKSYAHYVPYSIWTSKDTPKREINISTAYQQRPLEDTVASLVHEMVHMYADCVLNIQDTSRSGTYHNKYFKQCAEEHGLIVTRSDKYGWAHTEPADELIMWTLEHDELREIAICRLTPTSITGIGTHSNSGGIIPIGTNPNSHSRKYQCPHCRSSVRATKSVNIICADCMEHMAEV